MLLLLLLHCATISQLYCKRVIIPLIRLVHGEWFLGCEVACCAASVAVTAIECKFATPVPHTWRADFDADNESDDDADEGAEAFNDGGGNVDEDSSDDEVRPRGT